MTIPINQLLVYNGFESNMTNFHCCGRYLLTCWSVIFPIMYQGFYTSHNSPLEQFPMENPPIWLLADGCHFFLLLFGAIVRSQKNSDPRLLSCINKLFSESDIIFKCFAVHFPEPDSVLLSDIVCLMFTMFIAIIWGNDLITVICLVHSFLRVESTQPKFCNRP